MLALCYFIFTVTVWFYWCLAVLIIFGCFNHSWLILPMFGCFEPSLAIILRALPIFGCLGKPSSILQLQTQQEDRKVLIFWQIVIPHHNVSWSYRLQAMAISQVGTCDVEPNRLFSAPDKHPCSSIQLENHKILKRVKPSKIIFTSCTHRSRGCLMSGFHQCEQQMQASSTCQQQPAAELINISLKENDDGKCKNYLNLVG